ncbi:hypothetical protein UFOVP531_59 [uncultured Caudovirales phage]|uniref:Uncharacterized protein n=1 Tax=uncultured Caudovirales phage TaxID=2100421 RepID=A0A6J5MR81_9CAUD|nr:hypothetical protein UFOVP531_59 [uncultured Caudovirales phage]
MIYKLNYSDKETAIKDFIKKGVYIEFEEQFVYGKGIEAIVEIGKVIKTTGIYDEDLKEITAPVYADGYAYDVMSNRIIKFESEIFPNSPIHNFAGHEPINIISDEQTAI